MIVRREAGYEDGRWTAGVRVARGEIRSLVVKGDSICAGYCHRHELSKDATQGHWISEEAT